jgi:hypothetical protein
MWQIMRNNSIEVALFELEISGVVTDIEGEFETMDQYGLLALAFKKSAGDNALEVLRRYKSTAERAYHRAFQALEQIQKDRQSTPTPPDPAEFLPAVQTQAPGPPLTTQPNQPAPQPLAAPVTAIPISSHLRFSRLSPSAKSKEKYPNSEPEELPS